ncbi:MAG: exopolysaccharide biosynthesis GT4 family glycosyltransferase EpsE [Desulfobacca sp.]|uniref:exopolysaccharide biosynthesis GT4 family glycosyltransferase EpsE n=1 Tax=Desulfobacca sp. TaxID=2067990 RepID=UPI00404AAE00
MVKDRRSEQDGQIAYLIPEYPGQTHTFFWRELQAIRALGLRVQVFSTRKPPAKIISHHWASQAVAETRYLFPPSWRGLLGAVGILLATSPRRWCRIWQAVWQADVPSWFERLRLVSLLPIAAELIYFVKHQQLRHLHVHMCSDVANIALWAHLLRDLPYSLTLHNSLREFGSNQKWKWRFASFAIVISQQHLREVQEELRGFLPPRVVVAPMGVDLATWTRQQDYIPWQGLGPCSIFSCGRLNPQKNHGDLLRAVHLVRQAGLDARLTIAGGDDTPDERHRTALVNLIQELALTDTVQLLGAVSEPRVRQHLEQAHLFALASIHEGVPVSVMEAMAMHVPVVVTDVGGMRELVDDGHHGFIVPARRPDLMAQQILTLLKNPELAKSCSQAARAKIEKSFHSGISAATIIQLLRGADGRVTASASSAMVKPLSRPNI